ncbi:MAG: NAD(P)-binding protein [Azospirillum sp.]|nr:NAD(P)-binding protein [Azospirillum sp.]
MGSRDSSGVVDVVVVGAGLAGLIAARRLVTHGASVMVLEANDRVGGRILDQRLPLGRTVPLGATWFGPHETKLPALLAEFGLETEAQFETGEVVLRLQGAQYKASLADGCVRIGAYSLPWNSLPAEFLTAIETIDRLSREISPETPEAHPEAATLDALTVGDWIRRHCRTESARALLQAVIGEELWDDVDSVSFLFLLFLWRSLLSDLVDDRRIKGGTGQIVSRLAEALGDRIILSSPVNALRQWDDRMLLSGDGWVHEGRYAIVAVPRHLSTEIVFEPELEAIQKSIARKSQMAKIFRVYLTFPSAFWQEQGLSGILFSDEGPLGSTFDLSPETGQPGVLTGFISGRGDFQWTRRPVEERRRAVIDQLVSVFGAGAAAPLEYIEFDWTTEPWIGGGFTAWLPPGVMSANWGALRTPAGRIHWAGAETASWWYGSMEGAIESGERAADEVLCRLGLRR